MKNIAVLGAGSWGTALAVHLARAGFATRLWARRPELALEMERSRSNEPYLADVELPELLEPTASLGDLDDCEIALVVVPSHGFREVLESYFLGRRKDRPLTVVSATKGIETESLDRMSDVTRQVAEANGQDVRYAVLSGPTFAAELAAGVPSAAVVAAEDDELALSLCGLFSTPGLRLYSSTDVVGVELGGAAKNVVAVAAGMLVGLGLGHNTRAALITRGLHEMTRLGLACGGDPRTFSGLAGLGDLVLTCTGGLSRNRQMGIDLARGKSLEEIRSDTSRVAEGVRNSLSVNRLARASGVEMPIVEQMMQVIYEDKPPPAALEELMTRELKAETEL